MENEFTLAMEVPFSFTIKHHFHLQGQKPKTREEAILLIKNYLEEHPWEAVEILDGLVLQDSKLFSPDDYQGYEIEMEDEEMEYTYL
jgi:hypothetical protein